MYYSLTGDGKIFQAMESIFFEEGRSHSPKNPKTTRRDTALLCPKHCCVLSLAVSADFTAHPVTYFFEMKSAECEM
jgi:hypothetical protein